MIVELQEKFRAWLNSLTAVLVTVDICGKLYGNPSISCWDIVTQSRNHQSERSWSWNHSCITGKENLANWWTDWQIYSAKPWAMWLAGLKNRREGCKNGFLGEKSHQQGWDGWETDGGTDTGRQRRCQSEQQQLDELQPSLGGFCQSCPNSAFGWHLDLSSLLV